jgi:vitamin B12 transporter
MKKKIFIAAAVMFSSYAHAQEDSVKTLDEVIITATKTPIKQSQTGKVVDVITQDQLQKSFGKSLGEVLNEIPGMTINGAQNTLGANQTVYLRGASSGNTLILLDGIPLYDASGVSSEFDLNNFALDNIEKIEILKGSQSTLYGSDAVAGVINIITKKPGNKPFNFNLGFSAGSYETYKGAASLSGENGHGQTFFLSYNKIKSRGFSSAYDSTAKKDFDDDGFDQDVFQLNYSFKPFKKTSFRLFGKYNNNHADLDAGAFQDDKDYTNHNNNIITGAVIDYKIKKGFIRLQYSYNRFNRNFLDDSTDVGGLSKYQRGKYNGTSNYFELFTHLNLNEHTELLTGVDLRKNSSSQLYIFYPDYGFPALPLSADSAKTKQFSYYASLTFKQKKGFNMEAGSRWNFHNIYGNNFTSSLNPFFLFNEHYKIYANLSSGYRVPSIYQLYSEFGNKSLKPEVTTSLETGAQYLSGKIKARVTGFIRDGKDVFYFYTDPVTFISKYINADQQKDFGIETEATVHFNSQFSTSLNYTYVDGKISTTNASGKDTSYFNLYKRPKNIFNLSLNYQPAKDLFFSTHLKTVSKAFEPQYNGPSYKLRGYYTIGFYGQYQFGKRITIFADLENITGQEYFEIRGFNSKGFNMNAGIKFKM